eukprot:COSAG02_NODE_2690_length_8228_cov_10.450732_6_plen_610_part_00
MNTARLGEDHLRRAAAAGDTPKLARLLRAFTKRATMLQIESTDASGDSALMLAAQAGHALCVDMLVTAGANINFARGADGKSPLIVAAVAGHLECTRMLLARGADTEARSNLGNTAALLASFEGHTQILSLLLSTGANPEARNTPHMRTPLHYAASRGHVECLKLLLAAGADCAAVSSLGWSPAHAAASRGRDDCLWMLLGAAPDIASALDHAGLTPADVAQENGHGGCMDMPVELLLGRRDAGVDADMHKLRQCPPKKLVKQEQYELDNVGGCLHREAGVELPSRPHEVDGYQLKTVLRQPLARTPPVSHQRPSSAPATRVQAESARQTGLTTGFTSSAALHEARVHALREEVPLTPVSQKVSERSIGHHRPVPPSRTQHRGGKIRPLSEQRPNSVVTRVWPPSSTASTSTSAFLKGRSYRPSADDELMITRKDLSARRRRIKELSEWHRNRNQTPRCNHQLDQPARRLAKNWALGSGFGNNTAPAESDCRTAVLDDGSIDKLSENWSMLNRKTAELADLEQQMLDWEAMQSVDETGWADRVESSGDRYFVPDSPNAEDSFLEPGKVVKESVRPMWARSSRLSQSPARRYPYASVKMWTRAIGPDSYS